MEPEEVDDNLLNNSLKGLVYFTGLDLGGSNPLHNAIFNAFTEPKRERAVQLNYKILSADNELFHSRTTSHQQLERAGREPALRSPFRGIIKRKWSQKYLEQRPALIVAFVDLDWDSPAWFEKRTECESKITTLRQTIDQREIKLVLVLIQRQKTGADDSVAAEKALEICQHCRISSRHLYVFPLLPDSKATFECATRLEMAFHEITQEAYQLCFKRIRARNVPNNDPQVLIRQQFKLAFISELREDRHSALRYYRQAYQIAAELEIADVDNFELLTVAGLLNYKICELNFLLNSPVESLNQFRKHSTNFFNREPGVYPSRELAAIEFFWWKSQQCRIFAELFNRAVSNGLAAYPAQNPGRFLEEAASHCKRSNALVRQLRSGLAQQQTAAANQQRRTPPVVGVDQLIDLKAPALFFGQRPWRSLSMTANNSRASSEPIARSTGLAPLAGNPHLVEHAAKQLLEKNLHENYAQSIQLFSSAITQFKRYRCERFATLAYMDMADELMASRQFPQALQIFRHVVVELGSSSFRPLLRDALTKMVNAAFLVCNLNEWIWAMSQLLHIEMAEAGGRERSGSTLAEEIHEDTWLDEAQRFLSGNARLPFLVPQKELLWIPTTEEIDSVRQQWHHQLAGQQFQMDLSRFGKNCPIECQFSFLLPANGQQAKDFHHGSAGANENVMPSVRAGEPIPVQVILRSHCRIPLAFTNSSLLIEQNAASGKTLLTLEDWIVGSSGKRNGPILLPVNGRNARTSIFFLLNPSFGQALAGEQLQGFNRSLSPTANKPMELHVFIRRFSVGSSNGTFFWDAEPPTAVVVDPNNSLSTEVRMPKQMTELDWVTKIKVLPQLKKLHITGPPAGKIQMFTDESVDIPFTLQNNDNNGSDGQEVGEALKSVRVLCQKVYREEDPLGHRRSGPFIQHLLSPPASHQRRSMDLQQEMMGLGHTLVPVFNQEVATFLGQGESTDFCVRLQSKLDNCVSLQIQICSLLQNGEPAEWVEDFPIECCEPFHSAVTICCENGEQAMCLVYGQRYRVQVDIRPAQQVSVSSVKWKLNTPSVGICAEQPLSAILLEQLKSLTMLTTNGLAKNKPDSIREEIWIEIPAQSPTIPAAAETETQLTLGEATVEWSSANSCESVRSLLPLGQLPLISSPIAIQADLLPSNSPTNNNNNNMDDDEWGTIPQVGQPFAVRFTLWNSCAAGTETLLPVQIAFEQVDGLIFSGTKESFLTLLPDGGRHSFVQTFVPLCPGQLAFPKPRIKCISTLPDRPTVDLNSEELERLNRQIALYAFSALPASIFVMP